MDKKYKRIQMPFLSFCSKRLYRDVGLNWRGANLAYLFLLLSVCCLPPMLELRARMLRAPAAGERVLVDQLPDLRITNGHAAIDRPQPYIIRRLDGSPAAIIDTTGSMNYIDDDRVVALLTEDSLIIRRGRNLFSTIELERIADLHLSKPIVAGWLETARNAAAPLSYAIFLVLSFMVALLGVLVLSAVGRILSLALKSRIDFAGTMRIATAAATPPILFIALATALGIAVPGGLCLALALAYLFIGIKACSPPFADAEKVDLCNRL